MAKSDKTVRGFEFGNHVFLHPSVNGPLDRDRQPKKQILGAPPPTVLDGLVRDATKSSPAAKSLLKGKFCGHGEPTMLVLDVVIDDSPDVFIGGLTGKNADGQPVIEALAVRGVKDGSAWHIIFQPTWAEAQATLLNVKPMKLAPRHVAMFEASKVQASIAIGLEYPCDATSRDDVTWMTIDMLGRKDKSPICMVDTEMA